MMSICPNCGAKIREGMNFCPKCGTSIKTQQPAAPAPAPTTTQPVSAPTRAEKEEKREKQEKEEKGEREERMEKERAPREYSFIGPLVGGLVLIFLGIALYLTLTSGLRWQTLGALFFVLIGIIIIAGAAYAATMAARRHPQT